MPLWAAHVGGLESSFDVRRNVSSDCGVDVVSTHSATILRSRRILGPPVPGSLDSLRHQSWGPGSVKTKDNASLACTQRGNNLAQDPGSTGEMWAGTAMIYFGGDWSDQFM